MSSLKLVRDAIKAALEDDAEHTRKSNAVYVGWPEPGASEPFTIIGAATESPAHVMEAEGWDDTVTIHDYVLARDEDRLADLLTRKDAVLHRATLTITGFGLCEMTREFLDIRDEGTADNLKRHQITRWRVESLAS